MGLLTDGCTEVRLRVLRIRLTHLEAWSSVQPFGENEVTEGGVRTGGAVTYRFPAAQAVDIADPPLRINFDP